MREPHNRPVSPRRSRRLLQRYRYFHGVRDLDQTRELVAGMYCSHEMELTDRESPNAWMNVVTPRSLLYSSMGYGAASAVKPGTTESFFPVMIPLSGGGTVQVGRQCVTVSTEMAAVVSASEPLSMWLTWDCTLVIVCIDRDALECQVSEMIGEPVSEPLRFALGMDLTKRLAAQWRRQLLLHVDDLDGPDSLILAYDLPAHCAEQSLTTSLLLTQPHNYTERMQPGRILRTPTRIVRIVKELLEVHPERPHTRATLAQHAYCSVRALDAAFKKHTGVTPMAYLHECRLRRARERLTVADPRIETVNKVAGDCGITHLGRFAAEYQQRFGELPSTTLRRC